jgi:hypothetical protein
LFLDLSKESLCVFVVGFGQPFGRSKAILREMGVAVITTRTIIRSPALFIREAFHPRRLSATFSNR